MKINFKQAVLALIVIIIFVCFGVLIYKTNKKNQDVSIYSEPKEEVTTDKDCISERKLDVQIESQETYQENGITNTKYKVVLLNKSDKIIENWQIQINVAENSVLKNSWNGNFKIDNGILKISPVDYNNKVEVNSNIEIGFILESNTKIDVKSYKLFISGKEYVENNNCKNKEEVSKKEDNMEEKNVTFVEEHGKLRVDGTDIVDKNGNKFLLKGVSTHGIYWYPQYINKDTFKTLRDDFNANVIRLAMYSDKNSGYSENLHKKIDEGVEYAKSLGMYVIIDWHILADNNPNINKEAAIKFFDEMSKKYKDYDNVLYEICNEPNGDVTWANDIKPYAIDLINVIRKNDDAIIIVGTPNWSQDVDVVSSDKIENEKNIMYALHFYADTHRENLRSKLKAALENKLPVIVSEYGICDASGNGNINIAEANIWIDFLKENNISFICWNLSNKDEASSILKSSTTKICNWNDDELSECGKWLKSTLNSIK